MSSVKTAQCGVMEKCKQAVSDFCCHLCQWLASIKICILLKQSYDTKAALPGFLMWAKQCIFLCLMLGNDWVMLATFLQKFFTGGRYGDEKACCSNFVLDSMISNEKKFFKVGIRCCQLRYRGGIFPCNITVRKKMLFKPDNDAREFTGEICEFLSQGWQLEGPLAHGRQFAVVH